MLGQCCIARPVGGQAGLHRAGHDEYGREGFAVLFRLRPPGASDLLGQAVQAQGGFAALCRLAKSAVEGRNRHALRQPVAAKFTGHLVPEQRTGGGCRQFGRQLISCFPEAALGQRLGGGKGAQAQ